jgi:drug/metabolite transporter (DMT)-like permease
MSSTVGSCASSIARTLASRSVRHRLSADVLLLVTVLIWSINFAAVKYGLENGFEPLVYATLRFGIGSFIFAGITYGREGTLAVSRRDIWLLAGAAGLGIYLNQMAFTYSVRLTTASTVALVFGTLPIFVAILAWLARVERAHLRHWVAVIVSFSGVAFVAAGGSGELSGDLGGILLALAAAVTWAGFSILIGPLMRRYSPYRISAVVGIAAMVPLVATAAPQLASEDWDAIKLLAWGALAYSLVLSFVVTNVLWFTAIDRVGANRASLYANLQPFLGAAFAVVLLSETMTVLQIVGGVVIAAGILIARVRRAPAEIVD